MLRILLICAVILTTGHLGYAQSEALSKSDVQALLSEVIHNQRRMEGRVVDYTSRVRVTENWFDSKGRMKSSDSKVYEHYPAVPSDINILVEANGSPLPDAKIEKQRAKALKAMERSQADLSQAPNNREIESSPGFRILLGAFPFLRSTEIHTSGREILEGRETIRLQFRPKPGWVDPNGIVNKLAGTLWIDAQDRVVSQIKAWPACQTPAEGLFFEMRYQKVFPDAWALVQYHLNPAVKPEIFKGEHFDWSFLCDQFDRFLVEAGKVERVGK